MAWAILTMGRRFTCPWCGHEFEKIVPPEWMTHVECSNCIREFQMTTRATGWRYTEVVTFRLSTEPDRGLY